MLVPMVKVTLVGHRRQLDAVAALLHDLAVVHVLDFSAAPELNANPMPVDPAHREREQELRAMRGRVDALWTLQLQIRHDGQQRRGQPRGGAMPDPHELDEELLDILPRVEELAGRLAEIDRQAESLPRHLISLERLAPLASDVVETEDYETVALMIDRHRAEILDALREELDEMVDRRWEMRTGLVAPETLGALLVFPRAASAEVHGLLGSGNVSRVRLPSDFEGLTFSESRRRMRQRLAELPEERRALVEEIDALVPEVDWAAARARIDARLEQLGLRRHLGVSDHAFVLVGWIPEDAEAPLEEALAERVGPEVVLERLEPTASDVPPAWMRNPGPARPFETLVRIYGAPDSRAVDPTLMMSVFMPLFFGMMLGDIGYGAVLFVLAVVAGRRLKGKPVMRDIAHALTFGAVWAVIWGALFGEVFGDLGERYFGIHPIWLSRTEAHAVGPLLIFSLGVGAAHVALGLLIGIWQALRHHRHNELAERGGKLIGLVGLFTLVTVVTGLLPAGLMTPSIAALVVGTVVLGASKGLLGILMGPLEMIGGVGNILSYLRIAAIGLASVYLARVANELAIMAPAFLGVIVAVLLHALNLALGAFSPTIQALRLHYVEFFDKFHETGEVPYRPFGSTEASSASPI
jgi:V/A-type H+-transporting ATPase subunit I